jgi:exosortase/archaeosortase family protein
MDLKQTLSLLSRYIILLFLSINGLFILYWAFTPLTVYPVFWVLKYLYEAKLILIQTGLGQIYFKGYYADVIKACIGGLAYYALLILNLTTPMNLKKRLKSLAFLLGFFLILNTGRIVLFAILFKAGYQYFDLTHELSWYFGSTLLVVILWFANVFIFKIKTIPVYTDVMNLIKDITNEKKDINLKDSKNKNAN